MQKYNIYKARHCFAVEKKISQRVLASEFVPFALQDLRGRYSSTSTSYIKPSGISHGQRT